MGAMRPPSSNKHDSEIVVMKHLQIKEAASQVEFIPASLQLQRKTLWILSMDKNIPLNLRNENKRILLLLIIIVVNYY